MKPGHGHSDLMDSKLGLFYTIRFHHHSFSWFIEAGKRRVLAQSGINYRSALILQTGGTR